MDYAVMSDDESSDSSLQELLNNEGISMVESPFTPAHHKRHETGSSSKPPRAPTATPPPTNKTRQYDPEFDPELNLSNKSAGKRKKTSPWWAHYDECLDLDFAKCKYCKSMIGCSTKNGTTPLKNHIKRCKLLPSNMDKRQKLLGLDSRTVVHDDGRVEVVSVPSAWHFDQEACRNALTRMIVVDELPFAIVEREGFRSFCKILNPEFSIPSRFTSARDCYDLYIAERKMHKECFQKLSSRVSLTTDAWTSAQNLSYMCLTAHFIDDDWVLHKRIINFCPLAGHSGQLIGRAVEKCLVDWGIKNVMTLTVDNASSNDLAVDYLRRRLNHWESSILEGKYLHMRCGAHVLNLVVKDGLKDLDASIAKIRGLVKYVRSSSARLQKFKASVEEEKLSSKSLVCLDVETRWNSTYLMLQSAVKFKKAFDTLLIRDTSCAKELTKRHKGKAGVGVAGDEDWKRVASFLPILKVFYDATLQISGSRYVTCNAYVGKVFGVGSVISSLCNSDDPGYKSMAEKMKEKYDKYWGNINNINHLMFVSVFLDPRGKMDYVDWVVKNAFDATKANILYLNVKLLIDQLFAIYSASMPSVNSQESSSSAPSNVNLEALGNDQGDVLDFDKFLSSKFEMETGAFGRNENKTELDKYMEDARESSTGNFNILRWWKDHQKRYPILSKMARDILAIPVSTVASESAFSTGGRVLDSFRTSLSPRMVEALICTQDWKRTSAAPIIIEENLLAMEQLELEEGMKELTLEQPIMIIDESVDYLSDDSAE